MYNDSEKNLLSDIFLVIYVTKNIYRFIFQRFIKNKKNKNTFIALQYLGFKEKNVLLWLSKTIIITHN